MECASTEGLEAGTARNIRRDSARRAVQAAAHTLVEASQSSPRHTARGSCTCPPPPVGGLTSSTLGMPPRARPPGGACGRSSGACTPVWCTSGRDVSRMSGHRRWSCDQGSDPRRSRPRSSSSSRGQPATRGLVPPGTRSLCSLRGAQRTRNAASRRAGGARTPTPPPGGVGAHAAGSAGATARLRAPRWYAAPPLT